MSFLLQFFPLHEHRLQACFLPTMVYFQGFKTRLCTKKNITVFFKDNGPIRLITSNSLAWYEMSLERLLLEMIGAT